MCGRYVASTPSSVVADYFDVSETVIEVEAPSFNVAPTDPVPAIVAGRGGGRRLGMLRWGLVPSWAKDRSGAARMINARAESVATKPAFRSALARRRCLLAADGFYEWERRPDGTKQPWFIRRADGGLLAFAGLWEVWRPPGADASGEPLRTCAIVTTTANGCMEPIHDRMPVVLGTAAWSAWLDRSNEDANALLPLLSPAADDLLVRYRVTTRVNSVRNNDPSLLERAPAPA